MLSVAVSLLSGNSVSGAKSARDFCSTGNEPLIREMEGKANSVRQYTLIGPDGLRIIPSTLTHVMQPGWKVILKWNEPQRDTFGNVYSLRGSR